MLPLENVMAQSLETLVMPGDVVSAHAEIESDCASCHVPFNRSDQRVLCLNCHTDVADDVTGRRGFHGKSDAARAEECANCHTDHEGRRANILNLNEASFDHRATDFELVEKHLEAMCADCHLPNARHRDAPTACASCHQNDDVHQNQLGDDCGTCHRESGWERVDFDHEATGYALLGGHADAACLDCHATQAFSAPATTCVSCHAEDDVHGGRSGQQCDQCHNTFNWSDLSFDHARDTDFELLGRHFGLGCADCHAGDPFSVKIETACVGCHQEDDAHDGHYGADCGSCHTSKNWTESLFEHNRDTGFSLNGSHTNVDCVGCHVEPLFAASPGTTCAACHTDDDVHAGTLGDRCNDCHTESDWVTAPFFDHDLAQFPLLGQHGNLDCEACHETSRFADAATACTDCHAQDDVHEGRFDDDCQTCHNPVAWDLWEFDHNAATAFIIRGSHIGVACNDCHRSSLTSIAGTGDDCASCHRTDDVHNGEFGRDCARCHNDESFRDVQMQ